ncbi:unnamed protein product [Calypogeia fissa]
MFAFRDQWRLQKMAAELYRREAQSAQPKYRRIAGACTGFQGARGDGNNLAQLEEQSPQTRARAAKRSEAAKMIVQNGMKHKVVGKIESRQQNTIKSHPNYGSRDRSRTTSQGSGSTHLHSAGTTSQAIAVLRNRLQRGIPTDSHKYVKVLQMCLKQNDLTAVKEVHDCIIQSGMEKNRYVAVTLLNVYLKCGGLVDARQVFDQLEKKSVITWTNMIAGYAKRDHAESAVELFNQMRQEGAEPDEITYLSILKACSSPLALKWGQEIHECIRHAGLESDLRVGTALLKMYAKCGCITEARQVFDNFTNRDVITWTVMIGALAQHGYGHEAYRLFCQMRREGFEPNVFTYTSILNASASAGALEWVKEVHGHASKAGLESDVRFGSALVHMYAKSGSIHDARLVFDRMETRDLYTWNIMIGGLAEHGCGHEALDLFRTMLAQGVKPDRTSFVAVLSACCHAGLLKDGQKLFLAMTRDYGVEPDIVHYTCMVNLLGRAGHLEEANLFISDMPVEPVGITWGALLAACRTYGNVELAEFAANELLKLEPNDVSAYVLLSNIYAAAGKWEKVSLVRTLMQKRGVRKEPGRSWIEVDNKVHEFVVGDLSHQEAKEIYNVLNQLTENLKAEGYTPDIQLVLQNIDEADKELALCSHSEKLAIAYGLMHIPKGNPIRVYKNLRVCSDCHAATKLISKMTGQEIIVRDANRFHHFQDGVCSCGDYW